MGLTARLRTVKGLERGPREYEHIAGDLLDAIGLKRRGGWVSEDALELTPDGHAYARTDARLKLLRDRTHQIHLARDADGDLVMTLPHGVPSQRWATSRRRPWDGELVMKVQALDERGRVASSSMVVGAEHLDVLRVDRSASPAAEWSRLTTLFSGDWHQRLSYEDELTVFAEFADWAQQKGHRLEFAARLRLGQALVELSTDAPYDLDEKVAAWSDDAVRQLTRAAAAPDAKIAARAAGLLPSAESLWATYSRFTLYGWGRQVEAERAAVPAAAGVE
jgi:hypothetical protein